MVVSAQMAQDRCAGPLIEYFWRDGEEFVEKVLKGSPLSK